MANTNFASVAEALGIKGITVHEPGKVKQALQEAFAFDGPVLVNAPTDPNAMAIPPTVELAQVKGFALPMSKLILGGCMDEVLDTVKSNYKHLQEVL
jgi:pyruvate dehydrogenase (quinone)